MELKLYWKIFCRRWWLTALIIFFVALTIPFHQNPPPSYHAAMRFLVGVKPDITSPNAYDYDRYYTWQTAEYLIDDLSEVVRGSVFSQAVQQQLQQDGAAAKIAAVTIQGSTQTSKLHRLLHIGIDGPSKSDVSAIAAATQKVLENEVTRFFPEAYARGATVILVDGPHISRNAPGLREKLAMPMRLFLALLAGLLGEFLLYYLDDRIWERSDLETFGWTVIAEIPRS